MKISFIATATYPSPPRSYGGEIYWWDLCECFDKLGHEVTLYAAPGSKYPPNGRLRYIPESYNLPGSQLVSVDPIRYLYGKDVLASDFIIDASHTKSTMEQINFFHKEHKWKTIGILNGLVSHTPMCPKWNMVVGSQKWKQLLEEGYTQFAGTPWEGTYGKYLYPLGPGEIIGVIPWACSTDYYTPGETKEDYYLWFSRPTGYKGLGRAINIARQMKIHLKLAMPMDQPEHKYWGEEYLKQIAEANAAGAHIEFVKLPNNSQHHIAKRELYQRAKALLFTIESEEPFGLTVVEALACGTPVLASRIGCYTDDIKVLTPSGIKNYQECKVGDKVWSINDKGLLEAKPIKTIMEYDYEGEVVHFKNGAYDFRVTPNHRMLIKEPRRKKSSYEVQYLKAIELRKQGKGPTEIADIVGVPRGTVDKWIYSGVKPKGIAISTTKDFAKDYQYLAAQELVGTWHYQLPITCSWEGRLINIKRFPTNYNSRRLSDDMDSGDLFELIGWYISEGCIGYGASKRKCTNKTCIRLCEPKRGHYRIELENLLTRLGIKYSNKEEYVSFCHAELAKLFSEAGEGAENKTIPAWLLEAGPNLLNRLFLGIMKGDGWKQHNRFYGLSTISFTLVQSFLELCLKLGVHARWRQMPPRNHYFDGRIIKSGISYEVYVNSRKGYVKPKDITKEYYKGKVWCFEVEDNHNLLIGKNQFAFCGNSMPEIIKQGHTGYLIEMEGDTGDPQNMVGWRRAIGWLEEGLIDPADCRKDAVERFDRMVAAKMYLELYRMARRRTNQA